MKMLFPKKEDANDSKIDEDVASILFDKFDKQYSLLVERIQERANTEEDFASKTYNSHKINKIINKKDEK